MEIIDNTVTALIDIDKKEVRFYGKDQMRLGGKIKVQFPDGVVCSEHTLIASYKDEPIEIKVAITQPSHTFNVQESLF